MIIDQIPPLAHLLRVLEEMSLMATATSPNKVHLLVQNAPTIMNSLTKAKNWAEISKHQLRSYFRLKEEEERDFMKQLAELYDDEMVDGIVDGFRCAKCGGEALKRCSRCKSLWYCSRECQVTFSFWLLSLLGCSLPRTPSEMPQTRGRAKKRRNQHSD